MSVLDSIVHYIQPALPVIIVVSVSVNQVSQVMLMTAVDADLYPEMNVSQMPSAPRPINVELKEVFVNVSPFVKLLGVGQVLFALPIIMLHSVNVLLDSLLVTLMIQIMVVLLSAASLMKTALLTKLAIGWTIPVLMSVLMLVEKMPSV